jgi:DNA-binding beta-propeller fold protein YncE
VAGGKPIGVAADPAAHEVYVGNDYDQTLSVIDDTTNTVTAPSAWAATFRRVWLWTR